MSLGLNPIRLACTATVFVQVWSVKLRMNGVMMPSVGMRGRPCDRIDQRSYRCFTLAGTTFAPRWKDAGLNTLLIVKRSRQNLDGSVLSEEVSYFLSNAQPTTQAQADELFDAIRHHSGPPVRAH